MKLISERDDVVNGRLQTTIALHTPSSRSGSQIKTEPPPEKEAKPEFDGESRVATLFDRTDGWLPIRSESYLPSVKCKIIWEYTYDSFNGRKVLKRVRSERRIESGVVYPLADLEYEYESYQPVKSDFSLEQFGLPDLPEYQKEKPQQRIGLWVIGGGIVLVFLAFLIRSVMRWVNRPKSAPPAGEVRPPDG